MGSFIKRLFSRCQTTPNFHTVCAFILLCQVKMAAVGKALSRLTQICVSAFGHFFLNSVVNHTYDFFQLKR